MKSLFIPLFKANFLKIESGEQNCEIRPNGHRGWSEQHIFTGREITFSNGYGSHNRVTKTIRSALATSDLKQAGIPQWHIDAVEAIYGKRESWWWLMFSLVVAS